MRLVTRLLALPLIGLLSLPAQAKVFSVQLPELAGPCDLSAGPAASFDLGMSFQAIVEVRIEWSGTMQSGAGHGDGLKVPSENWFLWPAHLRATMKSENDLWQATDAPPDGFFHSEAIFDGSDGATFEFLLDGRGRVEVTLVPDEFDHGVMEYPPSAMLKGATLLVEGLPYFGDINRDRRVDVDDLLEVLLNWGPCPEAPKPCDADVNDSGAVDLDDLIAIVLLWE